MPLSEEPASPRLCRQLPPLRSTTTHRAPGALQGQCEALDIQDERQAKSPAFRELPCWESKNKLRKPCWVWEVRC